MCVTYGIWTRDSQLDKLSLWPNWVKVTYVAGLGFAPRTKRLWAFCAAATLPNNKYSRKDSNLHAFAEALKASVYAVPPLEQMLKCLEWIVKSGTRELNSVDYAPNVACFRNTWSCYGWTMRLELTTTNFTGWRSAVELHPPCPSKGA